MKKILEILFGDLEETLIIGLAMVVILTLIPVLLVLLSFTIKNIIVNFS